MLNKTLNNSNVGELFAVNLNGEQLQSDFVKYKEGELLLLIDCYDLDENNERWSRINFLRLSTKSMVIWANTGEFINRLLTKIVP